MTEHFTRDEAWDIAKEAGLDWHAGFVVDDENNRFKDMIEIAVTAKLKEWGAQGAVAEVLWYDPSAGGNAFVDQRPCKIIDASLAFFDSAPIGTKLYTHALPAQPAEPVNAAGFDVTIDDEPAKMLRAFLTSPLEGDDDPTPIRLLLGDGHSGYGLYLAAAEYPEEGAQLLAKISRAQAAPSVGVPDGYVLVPVEPKQKTAPVQGYPGGIPWAIHLEAYEVYCKKYGAQDALIDLEGRNCRGGFGVSELDSFIPGWRDRVSEFGKLQAEVKHLRAMLASAQPQQKEG